MGGVKGFGAPLAVFAAVFAGGLGVVRLCGGADGSGAEADGSGGLAARPGTAPLASRPALDAPFADDFPAGTRLHFDTPAARGWKQTGAFPLDAETAGEVVADLMRRRGYAPRHDIRPSGGAGRRLVQWEAPDGRRVLWALWEQDARTTGFSWGDVR